MMNPFSITNSSIGGVGGCLFSHHYNVFLIDSKSALKHADFSFVNLLSPLNISIIKNSELIAMSIIVVVGF